MRMLTSVGPSPYPVEALRQGWSTGDGRTVVVIVDPTAPNILSFKYGLGVQGILNRAFFAELQSRYGNLFEVREKVGCMPRGQRRTSQRLPALPTSLPALAAPAAATTTADRCLVCRRARERRC